RNHNHDDNPDDGSNWELLCVYCHDNEHSRLIDNEYGEIATDKKDEKGATNNPFAGLGDLLKK
ncbi:MAG: HNH endonuclease, partial [Gammaproteobacteria bacterium]|nr:HNH endonuclease [Gammaproteobacteria bacterium]